MPELMIEIMSEEVPAGEQENSCQIFKTQMMSILNQYGLDKEEDYLKGKEKLADELFDLLSKYPISTLYNGFLISLAMLYKENPRINIDAIPEFIRKFKEKYTEDFKINNS